MATVERGFLLLADLTGYAAYLARGELAHAPVIAGDLLETVVGRLEPPFRLGKLEGDARVPVRRGRACRAGAVARCDRRVLPRVPPAAALERHLARTRRTLTVVDRAAEPCWDAAGAVVGNAEGTCACCAVPARA